MKMCERRDFEECLGDFKMFLSRCNVRMSLDSEMFFALPRMSVDSVNIFK